MRISQRQATCPICGCENNKDLGFVDLKAAQPLRVTLCHLHSGRGVKQYLAFHWPGGSFHSISEGKYVIPFLSKYFPEEVE